MHCTRLTSLAPAFLVAIASAAACGGQATTSGPGNDGGQDTGIIALPDGGSCVNITPTAADRACNVSSDCVSAPTGVICQG